MKGFLKRIRLGTKLNLLVISIILGLSFVMGVVLHNQITSGIKGAAIEKAESDLELGYNYVDARYPGAWHVQDGMLFKGDVQINENFDLVDEIGEMTGGTVTIFLGDTRVTTNVMDGGERAVGTTASEYVVQTVLENQDIYVGEAEVAGSMYQTAYQPIEDEHGEVIGMWYVGASQHFVDSTISQALISFIVTLIVMILLAIVILLLYTKRMTRRLAAVKDSLELAGQGDYIHD